MKRIVKKLLFIFTILFISKTSFAQCGLEQAISVCNMESIDFDMDGNPDGIINLYTMTGTTSADGVWSTAPNISIVLDTATGNLFTWELRNASEAQDDYQFFLSNTSCGDDPVLTVDLVLGPYSGTALPPDDDDINFYICEDDILNLNTVLVTNTIIPSAHINGQWSFTGTNPAGGNLSGSVLTAQVDYQPGLPRVDQSVFELTYTVPGILPCVGNSQTTVKVSVVRQVDAGVPDNQLICESSIVAGDWDNDINVRDFLDGEDIEGFWNDDQNGNPQNLMINIRDLYNELIDNGANPRFGCQDYSYTYTVEKRSVVCNDDTSTVNFTLYEELRPFNQTDGVPQLCVNRQPSTYNLFDLLEFTTINGTDFIYDDDNYVSWRQLSGASDLMIRSQPDMLSLFIPGFDYSLGTINIAGATPGIYTFEYGVTPDINCPTTGAICDPYVSDPTDPTFSNNPCDILSTIITIEILPFDYAGEDTDGLFFCETENSLDLRSLLTTNGNTIATTGVWTDSNGIVVDNTFMIPAIVDTQTFTFTYSTITSGNCEDAATLSFTIFKEVNAGEGGDVILCSDDLTITLFEQLTGGPDTTGIWVGPFGYESEDHLGVFDANNDMLPILGEGTYVYTVPGNSGCSTIDSSSVTIVIVEPIEIGNDRSDSFCEIDGRVNLFTLLDRDTPRTGSFQDTEGTGALTPEGVVEFDLLPNPDNEINKIYEFRYVIPNTAPCDESSLTVSVQIVDLPEPVVPDQEFCILDAKRLEDIEVDVLNFNWYTGLESVMPIIDNPILLDGQVYYIANVDTDNCESERVAVSINILNTGERSSNGELCSLDFQDGVSPDGNNQNDTFDLFIEGEFNIPEAFPDFDLKIYNRYGAIVYEGNQNTEEFRGESNVSIRLGDDLPSGTYFYIFTPNFENNLPIQGSFYLSR